MSVAGSRLTGGGSTSRYTRPANASTLARTGPANWLPVRATLFRSSGHSASESAEPRVGRLSGACPYDVWVQTWDAITARRNVRDFADRPIAADDLDRILEAGRRSPSSQNWQPWDFVLVTDRAQLAELSQVFAGAYHVAQSAATIAIVGPAADNPYRRAQFDLGQAAMSMALAAADLGIGSCHAGVADMALAQRVLGLPSDRDWAILLSLGYPADRPLAPVRNPRRRPFDEVVHRGRWGGGR